MHYSFQKDLADGEAAEKEFASFMVEHYEAFDVEFNHDNKFDVRFKTKRGSFKAEVKSDFRSAETGNAAIEFECRGKPSGISVTQADFWVMNFSGEWYSIRVEKLLELIGQRKFFREVSGGDRGSNTRMYLFRLPYLKSQMKKL